MTELNLLGTVRCCRAAIPHLRRSSRGPAIVNVSSINALTALGSEPYSSAKAGVVSLTANLAVSLGPKGIRVHHFARNPPSTGSQDRGHRGGVADDAWHYRLDAGPDGRLASGALTDVDLAAPICSRLRSPTSFGVTSSPGSSAVTRLSKLTSTFST